jgi:hypothetical protein
LIQEISEVPGFQASAEVRQNRWDGAHFWDGVKLEVSQVWVRKDKGRREGTEDDVSELNAAWGNNVTQREVILAKKFREVM